MKKIVVSSAGCLLLALLAGCVARITPGGTYLEPLPAAIFVGPPVLEVAPPHVTLRPLPPVMLYPERRVYSYSGLYYYYWNDAWYYGKHEKGPWHHLPREYYPQQFRGHGDEDRDRGYGRYR